MTYCTLQQARDAGAVGTDLEVAAAIAEAERMVDAFTGAIWEQRDLTVVSRVDADGTIFLPYVVQSVTSVTLIGRDTALPEASYLVLSSTVLGQIDAVVLGAGAGWADPLIVGAEPWVGGYANLWGGAPTGQATVVGTFGPTDTPRAIRDATAALAAWATSSGQIVTAPTRPAVNDEGDTISVTIDTDQVAVRASTTGVEQVDTILTPLVRHPIRVG